MDLRKFARVQRKVIRMMMWQKVKQDLKERFLNKETARGLYKIPAGIALAYVAVFFIQFVFQTAFVLLGLYLVCSGLYEFFVNPIKAEAKLWTKIEEKQNAIRKV